MINLRISAIAAIVAFLLSFLLGIFSRNSMPMLLVRPVIFAAVFFAIASVINILVNRFIPELLEESPEDIPLFSGGFAPGSHINITEGDDVNSAALFQGSAPSPVSKFTMGAQPDDSEEGLGNISDLMEQGRNRHQNIPDAPAGMDQIEEDGYNDSGSFGSFMDLTGLEPAEPVSASPASGSFAAPITGGSSIDAGLSKSAAAAADDFLPDLDSMAGAFSMFPSQDESSSAEQAVSAPAKRALAGNKNAAWAGDFNAKEIAKGLQTVLSKDKE